MRLARLLLPFLLGTIPAAALPLRVSGTTDAVYVRPLYGGPYRHCGGECLKSGTLSWFCAERAQCVLNCAVAPPSRKCGLP